MPILVSMTLDDGSPPSPERRRPGRGRARARARARARRARPATEPRLTPRPSCRTRPSATIRDLLLHLLLAAAILAALTIVGLAADRATAQEGEEELTGRDIPEPLFRYSPRRRELEANGMVTYFHSYLGGNRGKVLAEYLTRWLSKGDPKGEIWHNDQLGLLVITDTPDNIQLLKELLEIMDRPSPQVMIEVRVVEVNYSTVFELGGQTVWEGTAEVIDTNEKLFGTLGDASSIFNPGSFLDAVAGNKTFQGFTTNANLALDTGRQVGEIDFTLRTLLDRGQAEILSAPRILVVNGKKASILTGEKVPVQTVQLKNNVQTITTSFQDVGIKLEVTPHVQGENAVELEVNTEVSTVTGFTDPGTAGVSNPIISTRNVVTTVFVRDGETLIIGGLLRNESVVGERGVPFLMDIPLLGYLFKSYRKESRKTELIFFLTPYIRLQPSLTLPPRERER